MKSLARNLCLGIESGNAGSLPKEVDRSQCSNRMCFSPHSLILFDK